MRTRKVYLLKDDSFTAARTKTIDINVADPIASIDIIVEMTNGAAMTEASVVKPHNEFTSIELVDGGDVFVSASMKELQALNFAELRKAPYMQLSLEDDAVQKEMCHIHFGVGRHDAHHYFDPKKYVNPQLKVTNTFTTAAATSWAASGHALTVIANVIEEGLGDYQGFLTSISKYVFTAVSGAIEEINMPRDYPYRLLQVVAFKTTKRPDESVSKLKLTCDFDKYIPMEIDADHLIWENVSQFGPMRQKLGKRMTNAGDTVLADVYYDVVATVYGGTTLYVPNVTSVTAESIAAESLAQT